MSMMMTMMKKLVNDCETNAFIITRHFGRNTKGIERMQMYMHLMGCPHCKKFFKQQKTLNEKIRYYYRVSQNGSPLYQLNDNQKARLKAAFK